MQFSAGRVSESVEMRQFSLAALLELFIVFGVLLAMTANLNAFSTSCLMAMAIALVGRQGLLALVALGAASLTADLPHKMPNGDVLVMRQALVFVIGTLLCVWCRLRGAYFRRSRRHN